MSKSRRLFTVLQHQVSFHIFKYFNHHFPYRFLQGYVHPYGAAIDDIRHPQKPHRFAHSFGWRCWTKFSSKPGAKSLAQINTVLSMSHSQIRRPENGQKLNLDDAGIPVSSRFKKCSFQLAHRQSPESLQKGSLSDETESSRNHLIFRWGLSHPAQGTLSVGQDS